MNIGRIPKELLRLSVPIIISLALGEIIVYVISKLFIIPSSGLYLLTLILTAGIAFVLSSLMMPWILHIYPKQKDKKY